MAKSPQLKLYKILAYKSGPNHWSCLEKTYKGKVPKKDNPKNTFIEKQGCIEGNLFWFIEPIVMDDGGVMKYWPLEVSV